MKAEPIAIVVSSDEPPPEYDGKTRITGRTAEVLAAAGRLAPGEWFTWPKPPGNWKKKLGLFARLPVKVYRTADKRVVIRHQEAAPEPPRHPKVGTPSARTRDSSPTPGHPKHRAVLVALRAVGRAADRAVLSAKCGPIGLADAIAELVKAGWIEPVSVQGREAFSLTPAGRDAAEAIHE